MVVSLPSISAASPLLAEMGWFEGVSVAVLGIVVWRMWSTQNAIKAALAKESRRLREEKQKNNEAQQALESVERENKAKSEMLAALSRDIRGHLNGIMGAADLLVDPALKPRQREHLTTLRASAESLHQSLNDIVDYSAIETGQLQIAQARFDLRQPLNDVIETLSPLALVKGLDLILIVTPNVPLEVTGDIARLRQILLNLTSNAVRFTTQGRVVLRVAPTDGDVAAPAGSVGLHFSVSDTGPAIPENVLTTIFDRPSSSAPASPRSFGGAGLELAIVKRLVGLMGGKIGARNLPEGGSEFWIDLAVPAGREPAPPRIPGLHVVALDELAAGRIAVSAILTRLGIDHDATDSVPQAIEMLHDAMDAEATELVLLVDETPAKLHSARLARLLTADSALKDTRIVLMSADPEGVAPSLYDFPLISVVRKPLLRPESLLDALLATPSPAGPRVSNSRAPFAPPPPPPTEANTAPLVLVVDDDSISRSVSSQLLAILGCRVEAVISGQAAIERARETAYNLIFMDCQMPELDGYETTRRILAAGNGRTPPIVALTANTSAKDREKCFSSGMSDFVPKPVHKADLARILQRWARREAGAATK